MRLIPVRARFLNGVIFASVIFAWAFCAGSFRSRDGYGAEPLDPEHAAKMAKGTELFKREVRGILTGRCVKCHGGERTEGKLDLNSREALLRGGESGDAIVVGKSKDSLLYKLVAHLDEPRMPEDGAKLSNEALGAIAAWIDLGAPYDKPLVTPDEDPLAWTQRQIEDARRDFWSFLPLRRPAVPDYAKHPWRRNDIDSFILEKLAARDMKPNDPTDRRTLVRRVYFDLLGYPPSPEEVDQFVADADPEAFARLIDRLLDNPHYGERWARHWLDLVRFGESHGFEQDYDRPHAYHYRDFVIKALNQDLPYDQFVRWQIAGDEYEPDNPLALMATGFLGAGVFPTQLTEKEFESARYDELDDMVATLGTSMLGLTVGCSRCHDHKYDPIPAADYYRLVSAFATAIRSNIELDLDRPATQKKLAAWEAEHAPLVAELERFEREQLPARFEAWLRDQRAKAAPTAGAETKPWTILDLVEYKSAGGATLTPQPDGSLLASGANPDFDSYTLVAETDLLGITALRLEALAHDSFTKRGPGRAANGNFGLSRIKVSAQPLAGGPAVEVKLTDPRATFQQNEGNLSLAASLDADPKSGWAVDPKFGADHAAVFAVEGQLGFEGGTKLTITLEFNVNHKHAIGRPRLAVSTAPRPVPLDGEAERQGIIELRRLAAGTLNDRQRAKALAWYRPLDEEWTRLHARIQQHLSAKPSTTLTKVMVTSEGVKPIPHHADDRGFPHFYKETFFLKRGDVAQKQGVAALGFLQVLTNPRLASSGDPFAKWRPAPVENLRTSMRRRAVAEWITDTQDGAGQLLARVIVNRLWQHHFGRGLVATPNDFGFQGQRPSHPELLDWLAGRLIENGWRLKPIHKLIMTSATYQQSSRADEHDLRLDPENSLCWRFTPRRGEAETIRDAMLKVSGQLDDTMFGPGTLDENHKRRSIYFMIKRSKLIPSMQLFDSPEPLASVGSRPSTTIAPQALMFLNNAQVRDLSRAFARRIVGSSEQGLDEAVRRAYREALSRSPTVEELADAVAFLNGRMQEGDSSGDKIDRLGALTDLCQVLFSLNEFVYID